MRGWSAARCRVGGGPLEAAGPARGACRVAGVPLGAGGRVSCQSHERCVATVARGRGDMASAMLWLSFVAAMVPEVFGEIKDPTNIRIWSFNLKYVLKWDHVQSTNYRMTYTVNYRSHVGAWKAVKGCENITRTECDFSSADIIFHGEYFLRLRAHQGNWTSAWLCTESFIPSKDNEIGPPSIDIESQRNGLVVYISDLQMESNTSIKKIYKDVMYRITYWKENPSENANEKNSTNRLVVLTLEPWTTYCLKVLAFSSVYNKMGQNSSVVCKRTGVFHRTGPKSSISRAGISGRF
ncbi:interleukin-10 receptor subunit beta-like isoform X2 [Narcine bancroftii]|uniref:interleukin-10 receptor subunit beta-like isoform X2 n=1 Tax=Narcine bancroftii TaxID=1343680 RepID=UPI003831957C